MATCSTLPPSSAGLCSANVAATSSSLYYEPSPSASSASFSPSSFDVLHTHSSWDKSMGVCVSSLLTDCIRKTEASTFNEVMVELERTVQHLRATLGVDKYVALQSICDLYKRFISRVALDEIQDFEEVKRQLLSRAETFTARCGSCRHTIAERLRPFLQHDMTIMINSNSRMVAFAVLHAARRRRRLKLLVTESLPDRSGFAFVHTIMAALRPQSPAATTPPPPPSTNTAAKSQSKPAPAVASAVGEAEDLSANVSVTLIRDSAAASLLPSADVVLVGAEAVVESGGIINKVGTYSLALAAKCLGKPVYVAVESYKFLRQYPLAQADIPQPAGQADSALLEGAPAGVRVSSRYSDYTPPEYITLLFTDLGILTPSAVSDELIKLYHEPLLML